MNLIVADHHVGRSAWATVIRRGRDLARSATSVVCTVRVARVRPENRPDRTVRMNRTWRLGAEASGRHEELAD